MTGLEAFKQVKIGDYSLLDEKYIHEEELNIIEKELNHYQELENKLNHWKKLLQVDGANTKHQVLVDIERELVKFQELQNNW